LGCATNNTVIQIVSPQSRAEAKVIQIDAEMTVPSLSP
jgi:hypothetical protein